jgi:nitrogen regulatory protein P-II 1
MTESLHAPEAIFTWDANADDLWLVTAVIQPFKLDAVTLALEALPACRGATLTDCRGFGSEKLSRDRERSPLGAIVDYASKLRLDCAVGSRGDAIAVARAIAAAAHTGREGDGKVLITPITGMIGIRALSLDNDAL